jgi:hypothetical protein
MNLIAIPVDGNNEKLMYCILYARFISSEIYMQNKRVWRLSFELLPFVPPQTVVATVRLSDAKRRPITEKCSVSPTGIGRTILEVAREIVKQMNTSLEIPRIVPNIPRNTTTGLSGNWQHWHSLRALPNANLFSGLLTNS